MEQAESQLHHRALVGVVARERAGLGIFTTPHQYNKTQGREWRQLMQNEVRAAIEEEKSRREWHGRGHGLHGSRLWREKSFGLTCDEQSHTTLSSWSRQSTMSFPAHPTCTAGS